MARLFTARDGSAQDPRKLLVTGRLLGAYEESGLLMKSFAGVAKGNKDYEREARRMRLGGARMDRPGDEMLSIVAFAIESGASAKHALRMLVARLEHAHEITDSIRAKTGSMQTLTYIGMSFFFPLFASISANIISSTFAMPGQAQFASSGIVAMALAYSCIILLISESFAHPERSAVSNALRSLPYFAASMATALVSGTLIANTL